jgi:16S rRNA processing protein RimM
VFPLTDAPEAVLASGRSVWITDLGGGTIAGPLTIARSRPYHREWLVAFEGYPDRSAVEGWRDLLVAASTETLTPPGPGEVYLHELVGFAVEDQAGKSLGVVTAVEELPGGLTIEVQGPKREFLLPYRKEFIKRVERESRRLVIDPPDGLLE